MAARGAKPKPAALRLITDGHDASRHGSKAAAATLVNQAATSFGPLVKPDELQGDASAIWDKLIAPAGWLDGAKLASAIAFCELWREFKFNPTQFNAGKHGQMRGYLADIGYSDERNRKTPDAKSQDPADEFF